MCECQTVVQHVKRRFLVSILRETTTGRWVSRISGKAVSAVFVTVLKHLKVNDLNSNP